MVGPDFKASATWALSKYPTAAAGAAVFALSMVCAETAMQVTTISMATANNLAEWNIASPSLSISQG
jgi:hypothetical protein